MCCDLDPAYASQIRLYFNHIGEICREYPYAYDWLRSYKEQGYGIYLLSNYAKLSFESVKPPFSFLPLADGRVISYEVQEIKPNPAIYHILLNRYSLRPDECVFIDDNSANIDTALRPRPARDRPYESGRDGSGHHSTIVWRYKLCMKNLNRR